VNVVGHFRYASGLQEAAFGVVKGLHRVGFRTSLRDLPVIFPCDWRDRERYLGLEDFDTTVYVAAVNTFPAEWYPRAGLHMRPGVRRIAVWYWELEELPAEWADQLGWADEVWAPTRFIADCFRRYVSVPVVPMLPGVELPPFPARPRSHFGLSDGRFTFLFSFDMASVMERKNPLGLIAAFRRAFRPTDPAQLVIKVSRGERDPDSLAKLRAAAGDGVMVIDEVMTREDALALMASADCYVSLHRSEGLGLGMAESMLLGKPVVATGYSGNLDFMTPEVAHLVEYRRVPLVEDLCPYPKGCHWADPSIEHAAELMRKVFDRPDEARTLGARAKTHAERVLSVEAAGRRMADRLRVIEAGTTPLRSLTRGAA
jgi:glycosyltransferase involved in cell wall biosynthesis